MIISNKKYGSPFIGSHWLPHFTISSLKTTKKHFIIKKFLNNKNKFKFAINKITLWEIHKEDHNLIKTAYLK